MKSQVKLSLLLVAVVAVVIAGLLAFAGRDSSDANPSAGASDTRLVREDSRVIGQPGSTDVVLVEFLDFECEACRAAYPIVEQLREKYGDQVTFVARYFPLPGHYNSERAARAVESAARQGKFDQMYQKMYETQESWGEQRVPLDDFFRDLAQGIGLDMETFDADYGSAEVAERVQRDVADGTSLGVQGTPTFFLDGERLQPESSADFENAIADALASR
ncbi:disulfide bond formation protein DsbA [Nocardioides sp. Root190]|uniref:DsbA family protein n=1 Tax=Nocardioides sp. Root190 TaxID=1736488 RepID=UPI0006F77E25|nr:thioredoxin domain-containing protein [Nocardioides sp. Root190]KRB73118.1 disulfide bond formation protein DsbA [Nocardioides sp. Root190]